MGARAVRDLLPFCGAWGGLGIRRKVGFGGGSGGGGGSGSVGGRLGGRVSWALVLVFASMLGALLRA